MKIGFDGDFLRVWRTFLVMISVTVYPVCLLFLFFLGNSGCLRNGTTTKSNFSHFSESDHEFFPRRFKPNVVLYVRPHYSCQAQQPFNIFGNFWNFKHFFSAVYFLFYGFIFLHFFISFYCHFPWQQCVLSYCTFVFFSIPVICWLCCICKDPVYWLRMNMYV